MTLSMPPPHTALVVDDDTMIRGLLGTVLKRHGIQCEFAENGQEAITRLEVSTYSAILLDLMMPVVDGFGVIDYIRKSGITTPVLVITAAGTARTKLLDPAIVKAVLLKPFEIYELIDSVAAVCAAADATASRDATLPATGP